MDAASTPDVLPPPPRRVRLRLRLTGPVRPGPLTFILFLGTLLAVGVTGSQLWRVIVLIFGVWAPGTLNDVEHLDGGRGGPADHAIYTYRVADAEYTDRAQIWTYDVQRARPGQTVRVRVLPITPRFGQCLFIPGGDPWGNAFSLLWLAAFLDVSLLIGSAFASVGLWRERAMVRFGTAVRGRITGKSASGQPPYLGFEYQAAGMLRVGTACVSPSVHLAARIGDETIVLYDPHEPGRHVLYAAARYRAKADQITR